MTSPLQGAMARAIYSGLKNIFLDATLTRVASGTPDPTTPYIPVADIATDYSCKVIVEQYSDYQIKNSLVNTNDRKILILANSLSVVPQVATDKITVLGTIYKLVGEVKVDPARSVWEIRGQI